MPLKGLAVHLLAALCAAAIDAPGQSTQTGAAEHAEAVYQQALVLSQNANHARARAKLFEAVQLWQEAHQIEPAVNALLLFAYRHQSAGRWQYAIECFRRVLDLDALAPPRKASTLISLAQLYLDLRQFDLALTTYQKSLKLAEELNDHDAEALSLIGLTTTYGEEGKSAQALSCLDRARKIGSSKKIEASVFRLIGLLYFSQGKLTEAREAMEKALDGYRVAGEWEAASLVLCNLSEVLLAMGDEQAALGRVNEALGLPGSAAGGEAAWRRWAALARVQRALARPQEALKSFYRAFAIIEKQAVQISADALQIGFMEDHQAVYREMADLLLEQGRADEAFSVIEYARSRSAREFLAGAKSHVSAPDRSQALQGISQKLSSLNLELRSSGPDSGRQAALASEIEKTEQQKQSLQLDAQMEPLKDFSRPFSLKQLQNEVLKPGDLLLEFALTERRSYVWLITAEKVVTAALPGRSIIDRSVEEYLQMLSTRPSNFYLARETARVKEKASRLFDTLLGEVKGQLSHGDNLIIVPDGRLHYLPFESLVCDGRYLIEDHVVRYISSASVFGVLRQRAAREGSYDKELLAFGDPLVNLKEGDAWAFKWNRLPRLASTRDEILAISTLFPPDQSRVYLGEAMKEETIKGENLRMYRWLHFATHSLVDERFSARSALVFSVDGRSQEDGLLTVDEIADLKMDCELVVLGACQTGRGMVLNGEGILGLARPFLFAGARAVAVSLWSVSDLSTAELMKGLYRNLHARASSAESLRRAKLELMARGKALAHPHYWAPFVLVGS